MANLFVSATGIGAFPIPERLFEGPAALGAEPSLPASSAAPPAQQPATDLLASSRSFSPRDEAARAGVGLALAAVYGLALGARTGGASLLWHGFGVPAALGVSLGIGVPALYIGLALLDAPVDLPQALRAASRATATTGLVLAGLAPAALLFVISSELPGAAALAALVGLRGGFALGLACVYRELFAELPGAWGPLRVAATFSFGLFAAFAATVALRVGWALLPLLGDLK
jgi:hypothetical protein